MSTRSRFKAPTLRQRAKSKGASAKAWALWYQGEGREEDDGFVAAFKDKGAAKARMARLKKSNPGVFYYLKHQEIPSRMLFK